MTSGGLEATVATLLCIRQGLKSERGRGKPRAPPNAFYPRRAVNVWFPRRAAHKRALILLFAAKKLSFYRANCQIKVLKTIQKFSDYMFFRMDCQFREKKTWLVQCITYFNISTCMHLADAFIHSDLHCFQAIHFYQYVFADMNPQHFAPLTQCSTTEPQEQVILIHLQRNIWTT